FSSLPGHPPAPRLAATDGAQRAVVSSPTLHDALPIYQRFRDPGGDRLGCDGRGRIAAPRVDAQLQGVSWRRTDRSTGSRRTRTRDRKSTRLNSSHVKSSDAVFRQKKKNWIRML